MLIFGNPEEVPVKICEPLNESNNETAWKTAK